MTDNKIYKWEYFWESLYSEIDTIDSQYNIDYLNCAKFWLKNLINWTERINRQDYLSEIKQYNLHRFTEIDYSEYEFYFDWCIIKDEIKYSLKKPTTSFNSMVAKIYRLFDFLLSYNSLKECPAEINFELYYVQNKGIVFYECKALSIIYDLNLNPIKNIKTDYCTTELLRKKELLREIKSKINVFDNLNPDAQNLKEPIHDEKITYSIISRGELIISYNNKTIKISGELIFNPPTFYADLITLEKAKEFTNDEKKEIINFISNDSEKSIGTKIIFD